MISDINYPKINGVGLKREHCNLIYIMPYFKFTYRGNPNRGTSVWILGICETSSNRIILYPVEHRNKQTLIPLIQKHVEVGSQIYTDGWAAYGDLNKLGFAHYTVNHNERFKQTYINDDGVIVECCTNRIEGAWQSCKEHFK